MSTPSFDKYDISGAYHWKECDKNSPGNIYNPALEARYKVISKRIISGGRALDIGCGDGYLMGQISLKCKEIIGIDAEKTAIDLTNKMLESQKNCIAINQSCYEINKLEGSFDTIIMSDVIEHLETPEVVLKGISQKLNNTGKFYVTTPKLRPGKMWDVRHVHEFSPEELESLLKSFFEEVDLVYFWPTNWINFYETKIGWRVVKKIAKYIYNPLAREGDNYFGFDQILAICRKPKNTIS
jgi:SAM-dependent methyltransferase